MSDEKKEKKVFVVEIVENFSTKRVVGKVEVPVEEEKKKSGYSLTEKWEPSKL